MPYKVVKSSKGGYDTVKKHGGKRIGHHTSKAKAQAQIRAIYASKSKKK